MPHTSNPPLSRQVFRKIQILLNSLLALYSASKSNGSHADSISIALDAAVNVLDEIERREEADRAKKQPDAVANHAHVPAPPKSTAAR